MLITNDTDIKVLLVLFREQEKDWVKNGEDPPDEFALPFSELEMDVENETIRDYSMESFYSGPDSTDVWLYQNELISDVLQENPHMSEEDIREENRRWFVEDRQRIYDQLGYFEILPGVPLKTMIPVMRMRGAI